jgi:two-component system NtrC family sensor kinase
MARSIRSKLLLRFLAVIAVSGVVTAWVGVRLIGDEIIRSAQDKVRLDLNSARLIYDEELEEVSDAVRFTALRFFLKEDLLSGRFDLMRAELDSIRDREGLDILTLTDPEGRVVYRTGNSGLSGDSQRDDEIVGRVLSGLEVMAATQIISRDELLKADPRLAERARMELVPTPMAIPRPESEETSGMMMKAAAPVTGHDGELLGVLYGGRLLNRSFDIVDMVKDIVYRSERYQGKDIGTATVFQGDLRISTNVLASDGTRAVGTRVSREVYDRVIGEGVPWLGRAFVVNDWYITAYEPVRDLDGDVIGMLYVGMLEAPYRDLKGRVVVTFLSIAVATIVGLSIVIVVATSSITRPLQDLLRATEKVAEGDLTYRVTSKTEDEVGQLADSFNEMTAELEKATRGYETLTRTLEDKVRERTKQLEEAQDQLIQTEKLSSLGKLAAGIAHEINNPLTSILINSHLLAERLEGREDLEENLKLVIEETTRCGGIVRGLLEFSRQTPPEKRPADINKVVEETMLLVRSNVLARNVKIERHLQSSLPSIMVDANKMKQVFTNIILNAIDAMPDGGDLDVTTRLSREGSTVEIGFRDTGIGMSKDALDKIFDPFFTTKGVKGTGLGLSISYGIVEQHGGSIAVDSEPGEGTTVVVRLPVSGG